MIKFFTKILFFLMFFLVCTLVNAITYDKWRIETDKNGRVVVYYEDLPVNVVESPFTSYLSVKIGDDVYNLGDEIGANNVIVSDNSITAIYKITPEILIEFESSFGENPLVYDDIGIKFVIRVISNLSKPIEVSIRYLFNPFSTEEKKVGFSYSEDTISKPIYEEDERKSPNNVIFYPFFINFKTIPSSIFLSNWRRLKDEFQPGLKKLLSFRDIKRGKWDPAIGIFYNLGVIKDSTNKIEFFLGKWQKPNRFYPRVKILYPSSFTPEDKRAKLKLIVENNGDFDIDYLKITLSSPNLTSDIVSSISDFKRGQRKEIFLEILLREIVKKIKGDIIARMMIGSDLYEQHFYIESDITAEDIKGKLDTKEAEERLNKINRIIEEIDLLLYFINIGIETKNPITGEKILKACNEFRANLKKNR